MQFRWGVAAACILGIAGAAATPPAKKTTAAKSTTVQKKATTASRYPAVHTVKSTSKPTVSTRKVAARPQYAPYQSGPTTDRYREIQTSLISKGYLQGEPTGVWDSNSVDAMKKFQTDQKLDATGKITSKSIIILGLGPRDESTSTASTPTTNK